MCQSLSLQTSMLRALFASSDYGDSLARMIAEKCGVSIPLVYQWADGSKTMSPDYLPVLYAETGDSRVYSMLMPVGAVFVPPSGKPAQKDVLRMAAAAMRESAEAQTATLESMADNLLEYGELDYMLTQAQEATAAQAAFAVAIKNRMEAVCTVRQ